MEEHKNLIGKTYKIFGTPLTLEVKNVHEVYPGLIVASFKDNNYVCNIQLLRTENGEVVVT